MDNWFCLLDDEQCCVSRQGKTTQVRSLFLNPYFSLFTLVTFTLHPSPLHHFLLILSQSFLTSQRFLEIELYSRTAPATPLSPFTNLHPLIPSPPSHLHPSSLPPLPLPPLPLHPLTPNRFLEIELYITEPSLHPDPYTHGQPQQHTAANFYFHSRVNGKTGVRTYQEGAWAGIV